MILIIQQQYQKSIRLQDKDPYYASAYALKFPNSRGMSRVRSFHKLFFTFSYLRRCVQFFFLIVNIINSFFFFQVFQVTNNAFYSSEFILELQSATPYLFLPIFFLSFVFLFLSFFFLFFVLSIVCFLNRHHRHLLFCPSYHYQKKRKEKKKEKKLEH